jgi:hypothetical protein
MVAAQTNLFDVEEIIYNTDKKQEKIKSKKTTKKEKNKCKIGKANEKVSKVIGEIKMNETIHYTSIGEWSSHDLLFHILKQIGPASVYISTWSISEDATRKMLDHVKNGSIKKLSCVLDWRVKVRRPEVYELAKYNISDIRLTTCHAKVTVIENDQWNIAIIGSANYTNNPRIEAGVIACYKDVADFHKKWMKEEMLNSDPFETKKRNKRDVR